MYRQKYSDNFSFIFRLPYKYVNPVNLFYFSSQNPRSFLLKNSIFSAIFYMGLTELFILAVGLSMDAFAVAVCKGLAMPKVTWKKITAVGLWFGGFQALMPAAGYFLGIRFKDGITAIDHWIAFMLLSIIGINMIREAFSGDEESSNDLLDCKTMFPLAVATSIDALAVGITFAFLNVHIIPAVSFIGVITFIIAAAGVKIGNIFGTRYKAKAELAGGIILILLGVKILLEHLGIF